MSIPHTIVLPLDGSACAEAALPHATGLAVRFGARLLLVRVLPPRVPPWQDPQGTRCTAAVQARAYLGGVAARVRAAFPELSVGVALPSGPAADTILDEAALEHADLIVMAAHGGDQPALYHLGRIAQTVLRQTEVPVLVVPAPRPRSGFPPTFADHDPSTLTHGDVAAPAGTGRGDPRDTRNSGRERSLEAP